MAAVAMQNKPAKPANGASNMIGFNEAMPNVDEPIPYTPTPERAAVEQKEAALANEAELLPIDDPIEIPQTMKKVKEVRYEFGDDATIGVVRVDRTTGERLLVLQSPARVYSAMDTKVIAAVAWVCMDFLISIGRLPDASFEKSGDHMTETMHLLDDIATK